MEGKILEAGGQEYRLKKEELERMTQKCTEVEKNITRMKTNLSSTDTILLRFDKDIEREKHELSKIEEANVKLKADIDVNTKTAEKLLSEMAAIEEEKKSNREKLDSLKGAFNQMKRDIQKVEEDENKAKQAVEEALN